MVAGVAEVAKTSRLRSPTASSYIVWIKGNADRASGGIGSAGGNEGVAKVGVAAADSAPWLRRVGDTQNRSLTFSTAGRIIIRAQSEGSRSKSIDVASAVELDIASAVELRVLVISELGDDESVLSSTPSLQATSVAKKPNTITVLNRAEVFKNSRFI